jgi:hypothetical protein
MMPLLNVVKNLIKFFQAHDSFVINMMQALEFCQVELPKMFMDSTIAFTSYSFMSFQAFVGGRHGTILMRWTIDLNNRIYHLAFECQTYHIWAKAWDSDKKVTCYVIRLIFYHIVQGVKFQCMEVATRLIRKL